MIKKGNLYQMRTLAGPPVHMLVEVLRTWDRPDIDPDCPESVAIVGMLEAIVLTGPDMGKKKKFRTRVFRRKFEKISEAE